MRKAFLVFCFMLATFTTYAQIGQWKSYLAYQNITDIEPAGNTVFVLSSQDLFSYNVIDHSVYDFNKGNSLSDTGISMIAWCESAKKLVIIYSNYNIDLLDLEGNVINISDYYSKTMTEDKTINSINISGQYALISTAFGVIKLDVKNEVIVDTYNLGKNVFSTTIVGNKIYAASPFDNVVLSANLTDNLLDKSKWTSQYNVNINHLFNINEKLIGLNENYLIVFNMEGTNFSVPAYNANKWTPYFNNNQLLIVDNSNVMLMNSDYTIRNLSLSNVNVLAYDAKNNCYWSNQQNQKLQAFTLDENYQANVFLTDINSNGPKYNTFFYMDYNNDRLLTCGGYHASISYFDRPGCIQELKNGEWNIYQDQLDTITKVRYVDVITFAVDPRDPNHVFAGARSGLYEFKDSKLVNFWNHKNSPLVTYITYGEREQFIFIDGLIFDKDYNLWILNGWSKKPIMEYTVDGEFIDHSPESLSRLEDNMPRLCSPFFHTDGKLWFANESWNLPALISYDITNDTYEMYNDFTNQDGTAVAVTAVRCATPDNDGNIWIGTLGGPLMLPASEISSGGKQFTQVKVPRNDGTNYADYLLAGIDITCIKVDGAGRKWFGTYSNGVYLISEDNMKEIYHFTETNSQLLSNNIESITIDNATGEVYFGTNKGLCSFKSDAVTSFDELIKDNVYAYPNPVRPDYTGLITVTGLTMNADVKIVSTNGTVVNEGRSNGGLYTWDGNDQNGDRVASGIYMVLTATSDGKKGVVCKIAIVN